MKQAIVIFVPGSYPNARPGQLTDEHPQSVGEIVLLLDEAPDVVIRPSDLAPDALIEFPCELPDEVSRKIYGSGFAAIEQLPF